MFTRGRLWAVTTTHGLYIPMHVYMYTLALYMGLGHSLHTLYTLHILQSADVCKYT